MSWRETDHPRDLDGRFTDSGGWVKVLADRLAGGGGRDLLGELDYGDLEQRLIDWGDNDNELQVDDPALSAIYEAQGYHAKPRVVTRSEMDQLIASGWTEVWRGVSNYMDRAAVDLAEEFRTGDKHFAGEGVHGNGTYTTNRKGGAEHYSQHGGLLRIAIPPSARSISRADIGELRHQYLQNRKDRAQRYVLNDLGRLAAAAGYDLMWVKRDDGSVYRVLFNRGILAVQEAE